MRIYLDVCCISRPDYDQTQPRVRAETDAIERVFALCEGRIHDWIASDAVYWEVQRNPDPHKRANALLRLGTAIEVLTLSGAVESRASELASTGLRGIDALHLAFAESGRCAILLTTDDGFADRAERLNPKCGARVRNPLEWTREATNGQG
ncbi:MAG: PIN domain-containing protein [Phycisphaeraceae bacterium]|nr:PIN domain-containing protein [Phycisphaeraceae bacterium]